MKFYFDTIADILMMAVIIVFGFYFWDKSHMLSYLLMLLFSMKVIGLKFKKEQK